jgi:CubicO group peptidase (beta-lactamase class C family)
VSRAVQELELTELATATVARLRAPGASGRRPASAVVGIRTAAGDAIAADGWARLPGAGEAGVPMSPDLLLDVASVTKVAATTALAMLLVDAGELDLATPAWRHLPALDDDVRRRITVEQLLTHTAGLRPWWPLYVEHADRAGALAAAAALPLAAEPGTTWCYSDLGLILAGQVVETITGRGLAEAFATMIAGPLGLTARYGPVPPDTAVTSADSDAYEHAMIATGTPYPTPYSPTDFAGWRTGPVRGTANDGNAAHALAGVSGHAGLFATVADLLRLGSALRGGFVTAPTLARFATPSRLNPDQAIGFRRTRLEGTDLTVLHHGGFTGTFLGVGLETELVVAGGAMRLAGTLGPVPTAGAADTTGLLTSQQIHDHLLDAARAALELDILEER